jgi:hypothetical protein
MAEGFRRIAIVLRWAALLWFFGMAYIARYESAPKEDLHRLVDCGCAGRHGSRARVDYRRIRTKARRSPEAVVTPSDRAIFGIVLSVARALLEKNEPAREFVLAELRDLRAELLEAGDREGPQLVDQTLAWLDPGSGDERPLGKLLPFRPKSS